MNQIYGDSNYVSDVNLIKHIQISFEKDGNVCFYTFTDCNQFDFWLSGLNSNKIYHLSIDEKSNSDLRSK